MRRARFALVLTTAIFLAPPVPAQTTEPPPGADPREMLESGTEMILRAFELMLNAIPQYEAPEVMDNGDIIIRRKKPLPGSPPPVPKPPAGDGPAKT